MNDTLLFLDYFREGVTLIVLFVTVIIVPSLIVGLLVSVFQAATQINEQTLSFLPRLLVTLLSLLWFGPWILAQLVNFTQRLIADLPYVIS